MKNFDIKIQHFRKCIYILDIFVCSSGPGLAPRVPLYFYTQHSVLKPACKINNSSLMQEPRQSRKKCVTLLMRRGGGGRWGGSVEKRLYDVSRGQNRYALLALAILETANYTVLK